MQKITIRSVPELIAFIETYNLNFEKYLKVLNEYTGQPIFWIKDESKKELVKWIREHEHQINDGLELPIFA